MDEPDVFSQQLIAIPSGDYVSLEYKKVREEPSNFLQGWFRIQVNGHAGWVRDDIIYIADKSSSCQ
jgi:hypothetical protein